MTSEDWKIVLLAAIAALSGFGTMFLVTYGEILRRKANENAAEVREAKQAAGQAKVEAAQMKELINGRLTEWMAAKEAEHKTALANAYANGHQDGMAQTMKAVAQSDKIPIEAQGVAEVVAKVSHHD